MGILLITLPAHAGLHKWVDEKGQIHYGDRVPPKYLKQKREVLNDQGVVVRKLEAKKTDEELAKEAEEKARLAEETKKRLIEERKAALRDRVLTDTFTSVRDIDIARDARTEAIDSQINLTETIIKDQELKLKDVKNRIESIEKSGRAAPENLHKEVNAVSRQLETHYQYVETKMQEREQIIQNSAADKKRFLELRALRKKRQQ
jgi:hypothetical protein